MKNERFYKNDKVLFIFYIAFCIGIILLALFSIAFGIYWAVEKKVEAGLCIIFGGLIYCFFTWLIGMLKVYYLVDVKLIRNKLYSKDNFDLWFFLDKLDNCHESNIQKKETQEELTPKIKLSLELIEKEITACKSLYDKAVLLNKMMADDVISQEDYNKVKNMILNK